MSGGWQEPIARLHVRASGKEFCGTGTIIETQQDGHVLLTCAHVINACLSVKPNTLRRHPNSLDTEDQGKPLIYFSLPFCTSGKLYRAEIIEWAGPRLPMDLRDPTNDAKTPFDLALLKILDPLPAKMKVVKPEHFKPITPSNLKVTAFGYSEFDGRFANGVLQGLHAGGWASFTPDTDIESFVVSGFSGGAFFDSQKRIIVGMVVALDDGDNGKLAFAIPTEQIWRACPQIASPYRGLRDFEEADADFFFGRDRFIDELVEKAKTHPIIGVSAASGAGKSSVIKAGLIPRLRREGSCIILQMRPGRDPQAALAKALSEAKHPTFSPIELLKPADKIDQRLREQQGKAAAEELRKQATAILESYSAERLFIYVDQFEELFTNTEKEVATGDTSNKKNKETEFQEVASDFRTLIAETASLDSFPSIQWCYSIRADFQDKLIPHRSFIDCRADGEVSLSNMTRQELCDAIRKPAEALKVPFRHHPASGENLVDRLADDAGKEDGGLPLLQHVLQLLWHDMKDRSLSHESYEELGELGGALNRYADGFVAKNFKKDNDGLLLRKLFFRLIEPGETGGATRRVVSRHELDDEELWSAACKLAQARLLIIRGASALSDVGDRSTGSVSADQTVEVAHEALLSHWRQLRDWVDQNRNFTQWAKRLRNDAALYYDKKRDDGYVLKGGPLQESLRRLEDWRAFLNNQEIEFIETSRDVDNAENEKNRKRDRWLHRLGIGLTVVLAVALTGATWGLAELSRKEQAAVLAEKTAVEARDEAVNAKRSAEAQRIAAEAQKAFAERERARAEELAIDALQSAALAEVEKNKAEKARAEADAEKQRSEIKASIFAAAIADQLLTQSRNFDAIRLLKGVVPRYFNTEHAQKKSIALNALSGAYQSLHASPSILRGHKGGVIHGVFSSNGARILTVGDDERGRLWDVDTGRELAVLSGHGGRVFRGEFSPDGKHILTVSADFSGRLWNAETGIEIVTLRGHVRSVLHGTFSPDGKRVLTVSKDGTGRLWNAETGVEEAVLAGHGDEVLHGAYSPDGKSVLTVSRDGTGRLWNAETGAGKAVLTGHGADVLHGTFSPDGKSVLTVSRDGTGRLWNAETGAGKAILTGHVRSVLHGTFSPDGKRVLTVSKDGTGRLWNAETGVEEAVLAGHGDEVLHGAYSPHGKSVLTVSRDGTGRLWNAETGAGKAVLTGHGADVLHGAFSPDGRRVLTVSYDEAARLWDAQSGRDTAVYTVEPLGLHSSSFSPDGERVLTVSFRGTGQLWNVETGIEETVFRGPHTVDMHGTFSPDGKRVLTVSKDGTGWLWNAETGVEEAVLTGHGADVLHGTFSPDGKSVLTVSRDGTGRLWNAETGAGKAVLTGHGADVLHGTFSPDGKRVLTVSKDGTGRLWNAETGVEEAVLSHHLSPVFHCEFSADGAIIFTLSANGYAQIWDAATAREIIVIKSSVSLHGSLSPDGKFAFTLPVMSSAGTLWDTGTGRQIAILLGHKDIISHGVYSPDGKRILTGSVDKTARLWDSRTGLELAVLRGHEDTVTHVAFSPDGTRALTTSADGTTRLWNIVPVLNEQIEDKDSFVVQPPVSQALLDQVFERIPGQLTCAQRREILKETECQ
ncbi:trypsin-like peptidase domain-containing protein [Roseibium sediminis]|uniref:nSTAND1 domain-containing NTPase n=1 Tax=Roseibium sediminis TaxID=1775174 RepID=UPI00123D3F17|nr:trypsin-like peptidase domain-containing protein [Roseibium sediminis]